MREHAVWVVIALLAIAGQAGATTSISTLPFGGGVASFGEPDTATYGQTITAPAVDNVLTSFSFWLDDNAGSGADYTDFAAYVMAWDGAKAAGPVLWSSTPVSTTNNGGLDGMEKFTFSTGNLALTSGARYVLFLNASDYFDHVDGVSSSSFGAVPYDGGDFVYLNNGPNFGGLTSETWEQFTWADFAFEAEFSSGIPAVPVPGSILLSGLGAGLVGWLRQRRTV